MVKSDAMPVLIWLNVLNVRGAANKRRRIAVRLAERKQKVEEVVIVGRRRAVAAHAQFGEEGIVAQPKRLADAIAVQPGRIEGEPHALRERIVENAREARHVIEQFLIHANEHGEGVRDEILRAKASILR